MRLTMKRVLAVSVVVLAASDGFVPRSQIRPQFSELKAVEVESKELAGTTAKKVNQQYWEIGPTLDHPNARPLTPKLLEALETDTHPMESQSELGRGVFVTADWRTAWYTYQAEGIVDPATGFAEYEITPDNIEGELPEDLVGVLYRNGPGQFGIDGERVAHVLDADGLVIRMEFPPTTDEKMGRKVMFRSKFIETKGFVEESEAKEFLYRGTFGSGPRGPAIFGPSPKKGLNEDPSEPSLLSKIAGNAMKTNIKNTANTQVISFGGKVLALFEAGLPYEIDPETLDTLGEDDMGGALVKDRLPVKISLPEEFTPDFIGGAAHTAHPQLCPRTGHLVGWHWSQLPMSKSLEATFTEWSPDTFEPVASSTFELDGCELAPHDMALTANCIILKVNALTLNQGSFLAGLKGPAAALAMDGRAPVYAHVFPRPTSTNQFEPFKVEVPPCFSIHFSHAYEDPDSGNIVSFFSGWPPSDSKDFLGAWGGFAPDFAVIPPTCIWRLEIDPQTQTCVDLSIAPGASNVCAEHPLVHPNFSTRKAQNVYAVASNVVGDSSAPCGYCKLKVEDDGSKKALKQGEVNEDVDSYWFGTRYFAGEPLIVPKKGGDPENEEEAYLLGITHDAVRDRSFLAVFDLERDLKEGPVCKLWLKTGIPHGLHGCFAQDGGGASSVFC